MIFGKSSKKKSRLGSGVHRIGPSPAETLKRRWGRESLVLLAAFVALVAALALEVKPAREAIDYDFETAQKAREDIRAEFSFKAEDRAATAKAKELAAQKVNDTYRVDQEVIRRELQELQQRIDVLAAQREGVDRAIRQALQASDSSQESTEIIWNTVVDYAGRLIGQEPFEDVSEAKALAVWLLPDSATVPKRKFEAPSAPPAGAAPAAESAPRKVVGLEAPESSPLTFAYFDALGRAARNALQFVLTYGVLPPDTQTHVADSVEQLQASHIRVLRDRPVGGMKRVEEMPLIQVPIPADVYKLLETRASEFVASDSGRPAAPLDLALVQQAAFEVAKGGVADTLRLDKVETEAAREVARREVEPVMKDIKKGDFIQRANELWTEQSRSDMRAYLDERRRIEGSVASWLPALVAAMIFAGLALAGLTKSLSVLRSKKEKAYASLHVALVVMCGTLALGRIVSYFGELGYLVPITAGSIVLAILTNARVASITGFLTAALLSAQFGYDWQLFVVSAAMSFAGGLTVHVVRRRNDMTRAAVKATIVGLLATAAVTLVTDSPFSDSAVHRFMLIALNGAVCLFIVPGLLPPLERLFGITTDIQLLEYSDLNNDVLSRMAVEVPATFAHSLMLGQIAEAAADAVGANGLLARVCAYYHDIGKLRRPEYFSENQTNGNVHDSLSPRLSARAIAAHVIQGAEMAREAHLPKPIIDGIMEHHGTSLISFFYQQALAQCKHGDIREEDFRYPGPRPQSRETAILMICDAVESGVRSIKNPNEDRVREFVDKIIAARAADRQFDESDLTLRDLDVIAEVVTRRVLTSLHTRIAYPEPEREKTPGNVLSMTATKE